MNIRAPLPPVFICEVWNYSKADVQNIQKAILYFNWRNAFESLSVDSEVDLQTLLNIFRNYIPNKRIKCNYRQPPWMADDIKKSLKERSKLTKPFTKTVSRKLIMIKC